jgi:hypothetical protein
MKPECKMNNMNITNQVKFLLSVLCPKYYISYENKLLTNIILKNNLTKFYKEIISKIGVNYVINNSLILKFISNQYNKKSYRQSFILPIILSILDINIPEGSENLTNYAFGVMVMSLIAILCFINVLGYFISFYVLEKYNIETRFPKLNKIKTYYQNTTLIFICFEALFCFLILFFLFITAYLYLKNILSTS